MAPAPLKHAAPLTTQSNLEIVGQRKRKVSSIITDENFVGAESNVVTKRLRANAAQAHQNVAAKNVAVGRQSQASVEDTIDEDDSPVNNSLKSSSLNTVIEAMDRSGNSNVELLDNDPEVKDAEEDAKEYSVDGDEDNEEAKSPETPREQHGKSKHSTKAKNVDSPGPR